MIKRPKGTRDYYGLEAQQLTMVKNILSTVAERYGFGRVYMPTFERTSLFKRSVGEGSDIVNKEMYTFEDKKGRSQTLRPEGTAQAARVVIENKLVELGQERKMFYIEKMYRYERPQKGRQREFIQFGLEWFGNDDISSDIQTIQVASDIIRSLGITKYELNINSIGSTDTREAFKNSLKDYIKDLEKELSKDSQERLKTNVLRILDSKDRKDQELIKGAPSIEEFLNEEEKINFELVKKTLTSLGIDYKVNPTLVRGLDYYNDLVFEFISTDEDRLGSQSTIIGGGRYNGLLTQLDEKKEVPAVGFAIGIERLMLAAQEVVEQIKEITADYTVVTTSKNVTMKALQTATVLREKNNIVTTNTSSQKLGKKLERADKALSKYVVIVGEKDMVTVKEFSTGEQWELTLKELKNKEFNTLKEGN